MQTAIPLQDTLDLEEATEPPDLEERFADNNADDEQVPPLDSGVCAFGGVAVGTFADYNVLLLVLDLGKKFRELADWRCTVSRNVAVCAELLHAPSDSKGSWLYSDSLT